MLLGGLLLAAPSTSTGAVLSDADARGQHDRWVSLHVPSRAVKDTRGAVTGGGGTSTGTNTAPTPPSTVGQSCQAAVDQLHGLGFEVSTPGVDDALRFVTTVTAQHNAGGHTTLTCTA